MDELKQDIQDKAQDFARSTQELVRNTAELIKPKMRGWFHALAAVISILGTILLVQQAMPDKGKEIAVLVYGCSATVLFGFSAFYHIFTWKSCPHRILLRRIDHANIFLLIAGTFTPISYSALSGIFRIVVLASVWSICLVGMTWVALVPQLPRYKLVGVYVGTGLLGLTLLPAINARLGADALLVLGVGGLLYIIGALCYAFHKPVLWSKTFGYHEVFHLCTVFANASFFLVIFRWALPFSG